MQPETSILLTHEPLSAILARVAYRVIQLDHKHNPGAYFQPKVGLGTLARKLQRDGFPALSTWVSAYAYHQSPTYTMAAYRQTVIRRARWAAMNRAFGKPWARVPPR